MKPYLQNFFKKTNIGHVPIMVIMVYHVNKVFAMHSDPESLYSFRFRFSQISVSVIKSLKQIRETAEFIPNQLRFHEKKTLANFRDIIEKCKKTLF